MAAGRDHTPNLGSSTDGDSSGHRVVHVVIPAIAAVAAHASALFAPAPGFDLEVDAGGTSLWPGLSFLQALGDPATGSPAMRALVLFLIVAGAALTLRVARLLALSGFAPLLAATLFAVSPLAGAALRDAAGPGYLLGVVAWLGMLALEPLEVTEARRPGRTLAQAALAVVAFWLSQGAALPCLFLLVLFRVGRRRRRMGTRTKVLFAVALVGIFVPLLFFREALPPVGYGHSLHEGLSAFADSRAAPGPPFLAALLASLGFGGEHPFLLPGRIAPAFSHLLGGLVVLVLLVGATFAPNHRRLAVRFGGLCIILASFGSVLVALLSPASGLPTVLLLPSAVGFAVLIASLLQGHRRMPVSRLVWPLSLGVVAALAVESYLLGSAPADVVFARAHVADPSSSYAAVRLAARRQLVDGMPHPEPLQRLILSGVRQLLPLDLEKRLGLRVARDLEHSEGPAAARAWLDDWLEQRQSPEDLFLFPDVRAQRIRYLIETGEMDPALDLLTEENRTVGSVEYRWRTARALLDALESGETSAGRVAVVVPVIEELLVGVEDVAGESGMEALLTLAELRLRQGRFTDAFRLAEHAQEKSPDSAHPQLLLARIDLATGEREEGLRRVAEALRLDAEDPHAIFVQGRLMTSSPATAERGFDLMLDAYQRDPGVPGGQEELVAGLQAAAQSLRARGELERLEAMVERASPRMSQRLPLLLEMARVEQQRGNADRAVQRLEQARAIDPGHAEVNRTLAEILRHEGYRLLLAGRRDEAVSRFRRAVEVAPDDFPVEGMQAVLEAHRPDGGDAEHRDRVERARLDFEAGMSRYTEGDLPGALEKLRESLRNLSDNPYAHLNIGRIELELDDPERAETSLRVALALGEELEADVEHGYLLLVRALVSQGKADDAGAVASRYQERHPAGVYLEQIEALVGGPR